MAASLDKDGQYTINGYTFYCAKVNDNYAVLHTPVLTECAWPGYTMSKYGNGNYYNGDIDGINISDYNSNTTAIYNSIKDCEYTSATFGSGLYLADQNFTNTGYASYFFTLVGKKIWAGKRRGDYTVNVYDIQSEYGGAINPKDQADTDGSLILYFNIDTSKINLNGSTITIQGSYQQKVLNETDTSYLLNKIAQTLNSQINSQATPTATTSVFGKVKPDGTTIQINNNGVISLKTTPVTIATNSNNGLVKPDDNTVGVKSDGTLYIKVKPTPIPPDPTPTPITTDPEDMIPYLYALTTDGSSVYAVVLNKQFGHIGSDGITVGNNGFDVFDLYEIVKNGNKWELYSSPTESRRELSTSERKIKDNYMGGFATIYYSDGGSAESYPEGTTASSYLLKSINSSRFPYALLASALSSGSVGSLPDLIIKVSDDVNTVVSCLIDNKIYKYSSGGWNIIGNGYNPPLNTAGNIITFFIIGSDLHRIDSGSIHEIYHSNSTVTTVSDTIVDNNLNVLANRPATLVTIDYIDGKFYGMGYGVSDTAYYLYEYNISSAQWKQLVQFPVYSDFQDFTIANNTVHYIVKNNVMKKITYYVYDLNNSSEWTTVGTCIPEIYYA